MTCQECELALGIGESNAGMDRHLALCARCRLLAEELQANMAALEELASDPLPRLRPRRRVRWEWALAAAAMLALLFALPRMWRVERIAPPSPPVQVVAIPPQPVPVKRLAPKRTRTKKTVQPLMVKMFTSDPDVVIYWLIDTKEGTE